MFHPVGVRHGKPANKPRTQYMLGAGGRLLKVAAYDAGADSRLMVPTEGELKKMLYEQVNDDSNFLASANSNRNNRVLTTVAIFHSPERSTA